MGNETEDIVVNTSLNSVNIYFMSTEPDAYRQLITEY